MIRKLFATLSARPRVYVFLWSSADGAGWSCPFWRGVLFPKLDSILGPIADQVSVHCRQLAPDSTELEFPRLRWSLDSSREWCHGEGVEAGSSANGRFVDLQIMWPRRSELTSIPDLYVQMTGWRLQPGSAMALDQALVVVLSHEHARRAGEIEAALGGLQRCLPSARILLGHPNLRLLSQMESIVVELVLYRGMTDDEVPRLERMPGDWEYLDLGGSE